MRGDTDLCNSERPEVKGDTELCNREKLEVRGDTGLCNHERLEVKGDTELRDSERLEVGEIPSYDHKVIMRPSNHTNEEVKPPACVNVMLQSMSLGLKHMTVSCCQEK